MNLYELLQQLWYHLQLTLGTDIQNGAAADIALSLSMAGILSSCNNNNNNLLLLLLLLYEIMDLLTHIATMEIQRKQTKGSRRAIDILMVLEKLAAAGCSYQPPPLIATAVTTATATATIKTRGTTRNPYFTACQAAAIQSLPGSKQYQNLPSQTIAELQSSQSSQILSSMMMLWSPRSLLWLWRRGHLFHKIEPKHIRSAMDINELTMTRQYWWFRQPQSQLQQQQPQFNTTITLNQMKQRPLVVDLGCGLGLSLLGLAATATATATATTTMMECHENDSTNNCTCTCCCCCYNYLGGDLSPQAIKWATSMARYYQIENTCQFCHVSTDTLLDYLLGAGSDDGLQSSQSQQQQSENVALILLQFPTPFRLDKQKHGGGGNGDDATTNTSTTTTTSSSNTSARQGGNSKFAKSPFDETFMANPRILQKIVAVLKASTFRGCRREEDSRHGDGCHCRRPRLLVQSNCEDVSIWIHQQLTHEFGLEALTARVPRLGLGPQQPPPPPPPPSAKNEVVEEEEEMTTTSTSTNTLTRRTRDWLSSLSPSSSSTSLSNNNHISDRGSSSSSSRERREKLMERAEGPMWSAKPILPILTETEAACENDKTPIHRCLYSVPHYY